MISVKAYEYETTYKFVCTQDEFVFEYEFLKEMPAGLTKTKYLQDCKANSIGLAEYEIARLTPVEQEQQEPTELEI